MQVPTFNYFADYTKTGFGVASRGKQIYIQVGRSAPEVFCKVSKKEFMKAAKGNTISGFTSPGNLGVIWVTSLKGKL